MRAVVIDMRNRVRHGRNDPYGQDQIKIFRFPVLFRSCFTFDNGPRLLIAQQPHVFFTKLRGNLRQQGRRDTGVHQQGFHGVADGNILGFAVQHNAAGCFRIGIPVNIHMTDPIRVTQDRDSAVIHNITHKIVTAPGNDQVDQFILPEHVPHILTAFKQLNGSSRKPGRDNSAHDAGRQRAIGAQRFPAALHQRCITAFYSQGRNLNQCVRTAFENDAENTDRTGYTVESQPFGQLA